LSSIKWSPLTFEQSELALLGFIPHPAGRCAQVLLTEPHVGGRVSSVQSRSKYLGPLLEPLLSIPTTLKTTYLPPSFAVTDLRPSAASHELQQLVLYRKTRLQLEADTLRRSLHMNGQ